jgi:hypothetical protein
VRVEPVDPRDQRWEAEAEAYRVYFWSPPPFGAWRSEEFEITDADVAEVLAWAEREASGRLRTVYVRYDWTAKSGSCGCQARIPRAPTEARVRA